MKSFLKHVYRRDFDEDSKRLVDEIFLEIQSPFHINVKDDVLAIAPGAFYLGFQRAIEVPFINFFPFDKLVVVDLLLEFIGGGENNNLFRFVPSFRACRG